MDNSPWIIPNFLRRRLILRESVSEAKRRKMSAKSEQVILLVRYLARKSRIRKTLLQIAQFPKRDRSRREVDKRRKSLRARRKKFAGLTKDSKR